ncbi:hypothetical protein LP421_29630 [Rhizobium sp. RCAM05350]|nr:hypothetical protein LP421_29630 [Rhizobium sp. RCAM05350]
MDPYERIAVSIESLRAIKHVDTDRVALQLMASALDFLVDDIVQEGTQALGAGKKQRSTERSPEIDGSSGRLVSRAVPLSCSPENAAAINASLLGADGDCMASRQKRRFIGSGLDDSMGFEHGRSPLEGAGPVL